jgi:hypothetical protein
MRLESAAEIDTAATRDKLLAVKPGTKITQVVPVVSRACALARQCALPCSRGPTSRCTSPQLADGGAVWRNMAHA